MTPILKPLRALYDWMLGLGEKPYALVALALLAFAESIIFPLPLEVLLIPMILGARHRMPLFVFVAALFSALGAVGGFYVGQIFADLIYSIPGVSEARIDLERERLNDWGAWAIATGALTPLPFKITTIGAGLINYSLPLLFVFSFAFRGLRYALIGLLLYFVGDGAKRFIDRWFGWLCLLALVLVGLIAWYIASH